MIEKLKNRIERLESNARMGEVEFTLENGARARIRSRKLLDAARSALFDESPTFAGNTLLHATSASDGSRIHELCRALAAGPVKRNASPDGGGGE